MVEPGKVAIIIGLIIVVLGLIAVGVLIATTSDVDAPPAEPIVIPQPAPANPSPGVEPSQYLEPCVANGCVSGTRCALKRLFVPESNQVISENMAGLILKHIGVPSLDEGTLSAQSVRSTGTDLLIPTNSYQMVKIRADRTSVLIAMNNSINDVSVVSGVLFGFGPGGLLYRLPTSQYNLTTWNWDLVSGFSQVTQIGNTGNLASLYLKSLDGHGLYVLSDGNLLKTWSMPIKLLNDRYVFGVTGEVYVYFDGAGDALTSSGLVIKSVESGAYNNSNVLYYMNLSNNRLLAGVWMIKNVPAFINRPICIKAEEGVNSHITLS